MGTGKCELPWYQRNQGGRIELQWYNGNDREPGSSSYNGTREPLGTLLYCYGTTAIGNPKLE
jgi:hypothetical protein